MASPAPTPVRPGDQLASTVSSTRVIVIRAPAAGSPQITCAGVPMIPAANAEPAPAEDGAATQTLIGKRYVNSANTVELLCTSSGAGELGCDGAPMTIKAAKALPASD
jgi:hypothetical protein